MKFRITKLALAAGLALSLLGLAPAAQAAEVPADQRLQVTDISAAQWTADQTVTAMIWTMRQVNTGAAPASSDAWGLQVFSCGNFVAGSAGTWSSSPDKFGIQFSEAEKKKIGKSVDYQITITSQGYDPYVVAGSYSAFSVNRPSCETINGGGGGGTPTVTVTKWSVKKGAARVGKTASVTATEAPGATVSYSWKVGSKIVDRDRRVKIKKTYKGKPLSIVVKVSKVGAKSRTKVLRYGLVR